MNSHNIFRYPYASFTGNQSSLLKVAAIYFDKLYILDPEKSSSGMIGIQDPKVAKDNVEFLLPRGSHLLDFDVEWQSESLGSAFTEAQLEAPAGSEQGKWTTLLDKFEVTSRVGRKGYKSRTDK